MLDVHPPHSPTHTPKDFFIHIATITVGLLIAVGIEQVVEAIHHHKQVTETREALNREREANQKQFATRTLYFRVETARFQNNLKTLVYLRSNPHATPAQWPAPINWHNYNLTFSDAAWITAESGQMLGLMPQEEVRSYRGVYKELQLIDADLEQRRLSIREVRRYLTFDYDPAHLTPVELDKAIADAEDVLAWHYRLGSEMRNMATIREEFSPAPTTRELYVGIMHEPDTEENLSMQKLFPSTPSEDLLDATDSQTSAPEAKSAGKE